jgi:hypothetical protein
MQVATDHHIEALGHHKMLLRDSETNEIHVTANRDGNLWTVSADGVPEGTAHNRSDAIYLMTEHALAKLPGTGYSTFLADDIRDLP